MRVGFVDECKTPSFALVLVVVESEAVVTARTASLSLRMKGQRRIHFKNESDSRRRQILSAYAKLEFDVLIFESKRRSHYEARRSCLLALADAASPQGITQLVFETDQSTVKLDGEVLRKSQIRFKHLPAHQEPCLWLPDAYGWVNQRGSNWATYLKDHDFQKVIVQ
jgi:hypothetical protein